MTRRQRLKELSLIAYAVESLGADYSADIAGNR